VQNEGLGSVGTRTNTTQQTNICLDIHLQICAALFNSCLSRLVPTKDFFSWFNSIQFISCLFIVGKVNFTLCMCLIMMFGTNFC